MTSPHPVFPPLRSWGHVAPHADAHAPAIRFAASALVPALALQAVGHAELVPYALLGSTVAAYGRGISRARRVRMQMLAGAILVTSSAVGTLVAGLDPLTLVTLLGVIAGLSTIASDRFGLAPAGALFPTFAAGAASVLPTPDLRLSVLAGLSGSLFAITVSAVSPRMHPKRQPGPHSTSPSWVVTLTHAGMCLVGGFLAGALAWALGLPNSYWAIVAAIVPIVGPTTAGQVSRAGHRFIGTCGGLLIAAILGLVETPPVATLLIVVGLLAATELVIARNYSLAMLLITPAVLEMTRMGTPPVAPGPLLIARFTETLIGVAVAVALILATHRMRHGSSQRERRA